jgi:hypothetical protein
MDFNQLIPNSNLIHNPNLSGCLHHPSQTIHHTGCFLEGNISCILNFGEPSKKLNLMRYSLGVLGKRIDINLHWELLIKNWDLTICLINLNLIQINRDFLSEIEFYERCNSFKLKDLINRGFLNVDMNLLSNGIEIHLDNQVLDTPRKAFIKLTNYEAVRFYLLNVQKNSTKEECSICLEEKKNNIILPCHHTHKLCRKCFDNLENFNCPFCRQSFIDSS